MSPDPQWAGILGPGDAGREHNPLYKRLVALVELTGQVPAGLVLTALDNRQTPYQIYRTAGLPRESACGFLSVLLTAYGHFFAHE
ncbi:MAG TPA: hypothetical protein V6D08_10875 [Candidatus Obscuribacterales bacterium]